MAYLLKSQFLSDPSSQSQFLSGSSSQSPIHVWKMPFKTQITYGPSSQSPVPIWSIISIPSEFINQSKAQVLPGKPSSKSYIIYSPTENLFTSYQCLIKLVSGDKNEKKKINHILLTLAYCIHHACLTFLLQLPQFPTYISTNP